MSEEKKEEVVIPKYLYHYTTIKTLPYMFQEDKVEFRFTDYRFLNDAEEGIFLKKILDKNRTDYCNALEDEDSQKLFNMFADQHTNIEEFLHSTKSIPYIMSFTECRDSMQFWLQDYAKDKGVCLKVNTTKFKYPTKLDGSPYERKCPTFRQVEYFGANETIDDVLPGLKKDISVFLKSKGGCHFDELEFHMDFPLKIQDFNVKNKVWESEKEWRLKMLRLEKDSTLYCINADYKTDELGVPRATIKIENPIEEIILGPSLAPQYVESIKMLLDDRGYANIDVHCGDGVLNY